ncbi:MAG TPA: galactokinase [bacterium]|nr:galactokinase [bacterium]HQG45230.1 galactokinase [bacterium]HQI49563.1 galactokinase [bacterium]HQJ65546.1 galactokinase [bacterium]
MELAQLIQIFQDRYGRRPRVFRAPGRVNLIGEHTDYNDGYVFPMALDRYTAASISPRPDRMIRLYSLNMQEEITFPLEGNTPRNHWSDYVAGVADQLEKRGFQLPGADLILWSNVPVGSGLSSSAALEISAALAFLSLVDGRLDSRQLALLGQAAENQFVGMNCGIMDQFISVHGRKDNALFLDCRTLAYQMVPLPSDHTRIIVCNTRIKHELGASEYNKRRRECETGVGQMKRRWPGIAALRDLSMTQFAVSAPELPELVRKRCRHVISENQRVLDSIECLRNGDLVGFGELMNASHDSLRFDYEVSCLELDTMVEIARSLPGCLGARMTGGGFGGCTVNLVEKEHVERFCQEIAAQYHQCTGLEPALYISVPSQGAQEWLEQ